MSGFFVKTDRRKLTEGRKENLNNTTIDSYLQDPPSSCMSCHQGFNARGRDFVGMLGSFR